MYNKKLFLFLVIIQNFFLVLVHHQSTCPWILCGPDLPGTPRDSTKRVNSLLLGLRRSHPSKTGVFSIRSVGSSVLFSPCVRRFPTGSSRLIHPPHLHYAYILNSHTQVVSTLRFHYDPNPCSCLFLHSFNPVVSILFPVHWM